MPLTPNPKACFQSCRIVPYRTVIFSFVSCQMISFFEDFSGFRKGHSTATHYCMGIMDDIIRVMKRGEVTLMVLADYSKAYDSVNFRFIITKMHLMGFSKNFLHWILHGIPYEQATIRSD